MYSFAQYFKHALLLVVSLLLVISTLHAKKIILIEDYEPSKIEGTWYVLRINTVVFDEVNCIKFRLLHDPKIDDVYSMQTHWMNTENAYAETTFNIIDDRSERARYFFDSYRDKVALSILGTDYDNWIVGFGATSLKDSYFVAARRPQLTPEQNAQVEAVLAKNEVDRNWLNIGHTGCPEEH